jgi:tetratricopeptide (TPR) repeat protein
MFNSIHFDFRIKKHVLFSMAAGNYKNWIIIVLFAVVFGLGIFIISRPREGTFKTPADTTEKTLQGPIVSPDTPQVQPLEQMGVDMGDPVALASLGDRYFESNNFLQAIKIYEKVLELNPNDVDTYNDLGLAFHYTGNADSAVETLRKGTEAVPSFQRIWLSLGFVLTSSGRNAEARPALQKAVELNPTSTVGQEAQRILGLLK